MTTYNEFNERIDCEYAHIQEPIVAENMLIIPIHNLIVDGKMTPRCKVVFYGVVQSERRVTPYRLDAETGLQRLGERCTVSDGPFAIADGHIMNHIIEGVFESSEGWTGSMTWDIRATSYQIEVE